jgi:hypothetical protein
MYQAVLDREEERKADREGTSRSRPSYKQMYEEMVAKLAEAQTRIRELETELELIRRGELVAA